jgi:mRNA-degrading endonuclease RelE of RelBE toxin-antitoxin system
MASGKLSEEDLDNFEDIEIMRVGEETWKNEDREKFEVLEVTTAQSQDDPFDYDMNNFRIRLVVELTDKEKNKYIVQFTGSAATDYDDNYDGEDYWRLYMAHGDLERLKISGYVVQYLYMDGEESVLLAQEADKEDELLQGLKARTTKKFPGTVFLRHAYMYEDEFEGLIESLEKPVQPIK